MEEIRATLFFDDTAELADSFELIPVGPHEFKVLDVKMGTAKSGRGRLGLQVEIVGDSDTAKGRKGWDNWNLPDPKKDDRTGRIFKFWKQVAKVCPESVARDGDGAQRFRPEALKGLHYKATISHDEFEGKMQQRFEWPYPLVVETKEQSRPDFSPPK